MVTCVMTSLFQLLSNVNTHTHNRIVPESPRWLLLKGNMDEALQVLKTLALSNGKNPLPEVTLKKSETVDRSAPSILDLFSFPAILIRTTVTIAGWYANVCMCST